MKFLKKLRKNSGFTLVECLISIVVFAIMALIVMTLLSASLRIHEKNRANTRSLVVQRDGLAKGNTTDGASSLLNITFSDGTNTINAQFNVKRVTADSGASDYANDDEQRGLELTNIADTRNTGTVPKVFGNPGATGISIRQTASTPLANEATFNVAASNDEASGDYAPYSRTLNIKITGDASGAANKRLYIFLPPGAVGLSYSKSGNPITSFQSNGIFMIISNASTGFAGIDYNVTFYFKEDPISTLLDYYGKGATPTAPKTFEQCQVGTGEVVSYFPPEHFTSETGVTICPDHVKLRES